MHFCSAISILAAAASPRAGAQCRGGLCAASNERDPMQRLAGGCSCDAVRFLLKRPLFVWVCHCNACKKRTGSAYGISLPVEDDAVEVFEGATKLFTRPGESGMNVDYEFCPACGTTVRWRVERIGNRQCFAGCALDDATQIEIGGEMYADEALSWARRECPISFPLAPEPNFLKELSQRARLST
jgi:hypothetical protein